MAGDATDWTWSWVQQESESGTPGFKPTAISWVMLGVLYPSGLPLLQNGNTNTCLLWYFNFEQWLKRGVWEHWRGGACAAPCLAPGSHAIPFPLPYTIPAADIQVSFSVSGTAPNTGGFREEWDWHIFCTPGAHNLHFTILPYSRPSDLTRLHSFPLYRSPATF